MRFAVLFAIALATAGCSLVYRIDIQQGNYVTQDLVDQLKPGMTRAQVKGILGTPLVADIFHANRWDYYFSNRRGNAPSDTPSRLTIYFVNEKVASFAGQARPAPPPPVGSSEPPQPVVR